MGRMVAQHKARMGKPADTLQRFLSYLITIPSSIPTLDCGAIRAIGISGKEHKWPV